MRSAINLEFFFCKFYFTTVTHFWKKGTFLMLALMGFSNWISFGCVLEIFRVISRLRTRVGVLLIFWVGDSSGMLNTENVWEFQNLQYSHSWIPNSPKSSFHIPFNRKFSIPELQNSRSKTFREWPHPISHPVSN